LPKRQNHKDDGQPNLFGCYCEAETKSGVVLYSKSEKLLSATSKLSLELTFP